MKIKHYICPRVCGKTTFAKDLQMEDPENTLLYTGIWNCGRSHKGEKYKRIILDEFLYIRNVVNKTDQHKKFFDDWVLIELIHFALDGKGELILISTPEKLRNSSTFAMIIGGISDVRKRLKDFPFININTIEQEIYDFEKNFLSQHKGTNVEIIKTDFGTPKFNGMEKKNIRRELGEEKYLTEIEGEFLK